MSVLAERTWKTAKALVTCYRRETGHRGEYRVPCRCRIFEVEVFNMSSIFVQFPRAGDHKTLFVELDEITQVVALLMAPIQSWTAPNLRNGLLILQGYES